MKIVRSLATLLSAVLLLVPIAYTPIALGDEPENSFTCDCNPENSNLASSYAGQYNLPVGTEFTITNKNSGDTQKWKVTSTANPNLPTVQKQGGLSIRANLGGGVGGLFPLINGVLVDNGWVVGVNMTGGAHLMGVCLSVNGCDSSW